MSKPSLVKGTRDFGTEEMSKRKFIFNNIEKVFQLYGFSAIETPAMETLETLTGKYGDEGDSLLFRILDNGNFLESAGKQMGADSTLNDINVTELSKHISSKALRYDLTVPFARFVSMNRHKINMPFRRYQMQAVWRADRPQKGRYREFWQCDADSIGSDSLLNEADLVGIFHRAFKNLGINNFVIHLNNRKVLEGVAEVIGASDKFVQLTIALDKFDKIGIEGVEKELGERGFSLEQIQKVNQFLVCENFTPKSLEQWSKLLQNSEVGKNGIAELKELIGYLQASGFESNIVLDGTLARGLNYYTGCIFEVKVPDSGIGSIAAGGRYDNLTGIFGMPGLSGVGISFGADRIYDLMESARLFPNENNSSCKILFCGMDEKSLLYCIPIAEKLRTIGISCKVYPQASKLKKQLDYANAENIKFAIIVGENEITTNQVALKDLQNGTQETLKVEELIKKFTL